RHPAWCRSRFAPTVVILRIAPSPSTCLSLPARLAISSGEAPGFGNPRVASLTRLWFRARRHGWGWTPASPEGWLRVGGDRVVVLASAALFVYRVRLGADLWLTTGMFVAWIVILDAVLLAVAWRTGERPRWRWGR